MKQPSEPYNRGFTLVELLVSIAIFMFLGIMLVSVFKSGLDMWHAGEAGKIVFRKARNVLAIIKDDITHVTRIDYPREDGSEVDIRFMADLLDLDSSANDYHPQRIRFVRTLPGEMKNPILAAAGTYPNNDPYAHMAQVDGFDDLAEVNPASLDKLGAPGGLMEVGYLCYDEKLYRAVRTPVGYTGSAGAMSLFNGPAFFSLWRMDDPGPPAVLSFDASVLTNHAHVLADNVLHFEMRFWAPDTETWDISPVGRAAKEAMNTWDSTRVKTNTPEDIPFELDDDTARVGDPSDDIFPPKVRVDLVIDADRRTRVLTRLVSMTGTALNVASTAGFVKQGDKRMFIKIGTEWIQYTAADDRSFTIDSNCRGVRNTEEKVHVPGAEVYQGRQFSQVMDVPGIMSE